MYSALSTSDFAPRPYLCRRGPKRRSIEERFWSKVEKSTGCWRWLGAHNGRYGQISLYTDRREGAHRVSYVLAFGPIPEGMCVLHRCDNPRCVRPDHLFLGTALDNMLDKIAKGRHRPKGTQ